MIVEIIGNGPSRELAPYDPRHAIWMMNNHAYMADKNPTALFEMHPDAMTTLRYDDGYKNYLRQRHPFLIYMHDQHADIPSSIKFPVETFRAILPCHIMKGSEFIKDVFGSTVAYMLGLASLHGYKDIYLYGIDLDAKGGHNRYRENTLYWIGRVAQHACIHLPPGSDLMKEELYPHVYTF